jgi:hypothetical protein
MLRLVHRHQDLRDVRMLNSANRRALSLLQAICVRSSSAAWHALLQYRHSARSISAHGRVHSDQEHCVAEGLVSSIFSALLKKSQLSKGELFGKVSALCGLARADILTL